MRTTLFFLLLAITVHPSNSNGETLTQNLARVPASAMEVKTIRLARWLEWSGGQDYYFEVYYFGSDVDRVVILAERSIGNAEVFDDEQRLVELCRETLAFVRDKLGSDEYDFAPAILMGVLDLTNKETNSFARNTLIDVQLAHGIRKRFRCFYPDNKYGPKVWTVAKPLIQ